MRAHVEGAHPLAPQSRNTACHKEIRVIERAGCRPAAATQVGQVGQVGAVGPVGSVGLVGPVGPDGSLR